ncbi:Glycerol kinase [compost metagenome]
MLGVTVECPVIHETTALGAAYLAGLAVGYWKDREDIASQWKVDATYERQMEEASRNSLYDGWKKAVRAAMAFK